MNNKLLPGSRGAVGTLAPGALVLSALLFRAAVGQAQESPAAPGPERTAGGQTDVVQAEPLADGERIRLDGVLDEPAWGRALAISGFSQQEPVEGGTPSQLTEVWVAYSSRNLYIAAIIHDDPREVLAHQRERDAWLFTDDRFAWVLDTFRDGRTGYFFETNAAGVLSDGIIGGGGGRGGGGFGGVNRSWDGIWEVRTSRGEYGWSLEAAVPFRTLNFDPASDTWGINFQRSIRRHNEEILWRGWRRNEGLTRLVFAGSLTGLAGMSQGVGVEARLSGIGSWRNQPDSDPVDTYPGDASLDLSYSITPGLRASLSLNTDFAEVESDQRRVNLTRFPLRFPERRSFFLEGSGVFSFAPRSGPSPFFSRRIGISGGEQIPINYGLRLTGQVEGADLGFYQMGTGSHTLAEDQGTVEREAFSVARVRVPILEQSAVGAIYTRRATAADSLGVVPADRHTAGMDIDFKTSNFPGGNNFEIEAFYVWNSNHDSEDEKTLGDLTARGFRFNFPNDIWQWHLSYREFGDDYSPAVGFVTRNDFRRVEPRFAWAPRPAVSWLRQLQFSAQYRRLWGLGSGVVEEETWDLGLLEFDFESGDNISVEASRVYEYLDNGFEVSDGVDIEGGEYTNWEVQLRARTASRRAVSLRAGVNRGGFWNGERTRMDANVTFRPYPGITVETSFEHNNVDLPQGDFRTNLARLEGGWNLSPWVSATNQLQYDDVSRLVGLFARFRWILRPGNDIYLVYTHNWQRLDSGLLDDDDEMTVDGFRTLSRGGSVKLNYTYRF